MHVAWQEWSPFWPDRGAVALLEHSGFKFHALHDPDEWVLGSAVVDAVGHDVVAMTRTEVGQGVEFIARGDSGDLNRKSAEIHAAVKALLVRTGAEMWDTVAREGAELVDEYWTAFDLTEFERLTQPALARGRIDLRSEVVSLLDTQGRGSKAFFEWIREPKKESVTVKSLLEAGDGTYRLVVNVGPNQFVGRMNRHGVATVSLPHAPATSDVVHVRLQRRSKG